MPFVTRKTQQSSYDVIVVGSGAGGGQTAYTLCMDGAKVLMLEAGRHYTPETETPDVPDAGHGAARAASARRTSPSASTTPRSTAAGRCPASPMCAPPRTYGGRFVWWRARMLGGRTNHWGRISLRNGPYDFKPHTRDGLGFDWPISYEDLAPYYDKVELLVGVYGSNEGLENTPNSSPGCLLPPPAPLVSDYLVKQRAGRLGHSGDPGSPRGAHPRAGSRSSCRRVCIPGNPQAQQILAEAMRERAPCLWATPCGRGCSIRANYQSTTVHLPPALATGNLDIMTDAMVYEVTLGRDGRANGVSFVDKTTGAQQHVTARVVVLARERLRIGAHPAQLQERAVSRTGSRTPAAWSGTISWIPWAAPSAARCRCSRACRRTTRTAPTATSSTCPGGSTASSTPGKLGFARGYHIEFGGGRRMPGHWHRRRHSNG